MSTKGIQYPVFLVMVLSAFLSRTPVAADMTVVREVTTTIGKTKSTFTQTIYFTKSKMRTNEPSGTIIITDLDSKMVKVLNPRQKTYIQDTFDDVKKREARLPAKIRKARLSVRETGEKKTIDEYPCEKLVFMTGPSEVEVWITPKITPDPAMVEFNSKFRELTKGLKTFELHGQMGAAFEKRKAYPYLIVIESPVPFGKGTEKTESKVKSVSFDKLDESVFAVPKGYRKTAPPPLRAKKKK